MKYKEGNIVLLYDERNVYICSVDKHAKQYWVTDTDDSEGEMFQIGENEIFMLIT